MSTWIFLITLISTTSLIEISQICTNTVEKEESPEYTIGEKAILAHFHHHPYLKAGVSETASIWPVVTEIPLLSLAKKSAKPLRAQSEYRFAASRFGWKPRLREVTTLVVESFVGWSATYYLVTRPTQFSLNIVISRNALRRFLRGPAASQFSLPTSIILPVKISTSPRPSSIRLADEFDLYGYGGLWRTMAILGTNGEKGLKNGQLVCVVNIILKHFFRGT